MKIRCDNCTWTGHERDLTEAEACPRCFEKTHLRPHCAAAPRPTHPPLSA